MRKKIALVSFMVIVMFFGSSAFPADHILSYDLPKSKGVQIGSEDARVHVGVKTKGLLDDNIYLSKSGKKLDYITILEPMIGVTVPFDDNRIMADYKFSGNFYSTYHKENHLDHMARGLVDLNFTEYKLTINDQYSMFTNRASMEDTERVQQQRNNFRAGFSTQRDRKLGFDVGYSNKIEDYFDKAKIYGELTYADRDSMSHIFDMQVLYNIAPKTTLILETDLGMIDYTSKLSSDSFYVEPLIGVQGKITNKIVANLRGGYRYQNYKKSDLVINTDYSSFVVRGGVDFTPTKDDLVNVVVERNSYESTYKNMNYYSGTFTKLSYTHNFGKDLSITPYGSYEINDYPKETTESGATKYRCDQLFDVGATAQYFMKEWISFEGGYTYKGKSSNFSEFDYGDNRVTLAVTVGY